MKTLFMILALTTGIQAAHASEIYCGANRESNPGSQVYDKNLFWEKADPTKHVVRFLLPNGTLVDGANMSPETIAQLKDGTLALGFSFSEGRPNLFIGKTKRLANSEITFEQMAAATTLNGSSPMLMAHGLSLVCQKR